MVGDPFEGAERVVSAVMRPLVIRSVSWKAKIIFPFEEGLAELFELEERMSW
jgi:hypothetical protein